jgi:hypothetical protein
MISVPMAGARRSRRFVRELEKAGFDRDQVREQMCL